MNIFMLTSVPVAPPWDQGDKNLAYMLACALPELRFSLLTLLNSSPPPGDNLDSVPVFRSTRPSLAHKVQVFSRLFFSSKINRPLHMKRHTAVDLYHLIYRPYRLSSHLLRMLPELRLRPTIHTVPATCDGQPLLPDMFFADQVVTLSHYGKTRLKAMGIEKVIHIPPGIVVDKWLPLAGKAPIFKKRLGLEDRPVVLFPGHYGSGQGTEMLLRAIPLIRDRYPQVIFLFACRLRSADDRRREKAFQVQIKSMGLNESVCFYNTVADMYTLIGASDLVLLPLESMRDKIDIPTTLLEAMAAARPIIISDIPPMNELVLRDDLCNGCAGLVVSPGDVLGLAGSVIQVLEDPALQSFMGKCGQTIVQEYFDIDKVAQQYNTLYRNLATDPAK